MFFCFDRRFSSLNSKVSIKDLTIMTCGFGGKTSEVKTKKCLMRIHIICALNIVL